MLSTDLTNCDKEPIHIPGRIQSHGFLIAVDENYIVTFCSENIVGFLPATAATLLGSSVEVLDRFFERRDSAAFLIPLLKLSQNNKGFEPPNPYPLTVNNALFNLILSKSDRFYVLEFEPEFSHLNSDIQRIIGSSLAEMLADSDLSRLLGNAAEQIKKIIGYDRVMVYKFHDDGHGEVVSEVKNEDLDPFFGLHYPASDIPKQARELYKLNLIRLISDVTVTPSALLSMPDAGTTPLDLTDSVLRAVSPIHIQYLKNMGVASSFSISLIHSGELWGLISCHNYRPRFINYKERAAAKLIGQVLSSALSFRVEEEDKQKSSRYNAAIETLTKQLLLDSAIPNALFKHEVTLINALDSSGAALVFENQIYTSGKTPDGGFIAELLDWLEDQMEDQLYETQNLSAVFPAALPYKAIASGLLVCRLSKVLREYMLWFRPEVIATVTWAGDPNKPVILEADGTLNISPRKSFEAWSERVSNTSIAWKKEDIASALKLKDEIAFTISRKATEIRVMNEKLKVAYDELDAFSYTISHDLKNPLSSIKSYSQLLVRKFDLEPGAKQMVDRILSAADKMQKMIAEVLGYSQVGQIKIQPKQINMDHLLEEIKQELLISRENELLEINIGPILDVYGDEIMVMQVFSNLISNAAKYSGKRNKPRVNVQAEEKGNFIQYAIRDNGVGIKTADQARIFDLFTRSAEVGQFEGTGVGLSIVKRIMEKHNGKIWVESDGENGSVFYVQFKKHQIPA